MKKKIAFLHIENGEKYEAYHLGAPISSYGEVVFNTPMTGYVESLTDPSYFGQILLFTYPSIGNYGVPSSPLSKKLISRFYESNKVHVSGLIVSDYSHINGKMFKNLSNWLKEYKVPGLYGLDTRCLTKILRKRGTMLGKIFCFEKNITFFDSSKENEKISIKEKIIYGNGRYKILLVDCGVKNNILRCLLIRNCSIIRVPCNYDFTKEKYYDGIFLSNGPGNPNEYQETILHLRKALRWNKPVFGICLGNQLLGVSTGSITRKLKYGHRSYNQPVILSATNKAYITSQNHGYVIDSKIIPDQWKIFFKNLNDQSCEGIIHTKTPFFSVQFHPEAFGGTNDTEFLFDYFIDLIKGSNEN
ncbi:MAG TPA: glutamine-hydrolyzing carbamoyl-phosphate synthase small subunit [Blattabacteriaceae bacterium]